MNRKQTYYFVWPNLLMLETLCFYACKVASQRPCLANHYIRVHIFSKVLCYTLDMIGIYDKKKYVKKVSVMIQVLMHYQYM